MAKAKTTAKTAKKSTANVPAKGQETAQTTPAVETPEIKDLTVQDVAEITPEVFKSMCGFDYDPSQASSCFTACQKDNPEAYAACVANFAAQIGRKATKKVVTGRRGKNMFGHLIGCQGGKIDDILTIVGGAHSLAEIMEYAEARHPRTVGHLKHLVEVWNVDLHMTEDGKYFIPAYAKGCVGRRHNGVKFLELPKPVETTVKEEKPDAA